MTYYKVGHMDQFFEKVLTGEVQVDCFGPAGGSRTLTGAEPSKDARHMTCRDGDSSFS